MKKVIKSEICKERPNAVVVGAFNSAIKRFNSGIGLNTPKQQLKNSVNELRTIVDGQKVIPKKQRKSEEELKSLKLKLSGLRGALKKRINKKP